MLSTISCDCGPSSGSVEGSSDVDDGSESFRLKSFLLEGIVSGQELACPTLSRLGNTRAVNTRRRSNAMSNFMTGIQGSSPLWIWDCDTIPSLPVSIQKRQPDRSEDA